MPGASASALIDGNIDEDGIGLHFAEHVLGYELGDGGIQQEIKRRTQKVRVFPNEASLERLVSAVLVEIDGKWASAEKAYIKWEYQDD